MRAKPDFVLEHVLKACQAINVFGEHAARTLTGGAVIAAVRARQSGAGGSVQTDAPCA